jgi:hypothetical protein
MILLFLVPPLVIGFLALRCLLPLQRSWSFFALQCCLGIPVGFGMTSCVSYLLLISGHFSRAWQLSVEAAVALGLTAITIHSAPRQQQPIDKERQTLARAPSLLRSALIVNFYLALVIGISVFFMLASQNPHGAWDAWAIWNLRARFLFRGADHWADGLSQQLFWSHPDYPLLIASSIARGWVVVGQETVLVPILCAGVFTFGISGLLVSAMTLMRDHSQGCLSGTILFITPFFMFRGAAQEADVPLAFYFLAFLVVLSLRNYYQTPRLFILLGLIAGFAAWVKNEGSLFLLCTAVCAIGAWVSGLFALSRRTLLSFFFGACPGALILFHFKSQLSPGSDLFAGQSAEGSILKLLDMGRHWKILYAALTSFGGFGDWLVSLPIVLLCYLALMGRKSKNSDVKFIGLSIVILGLMAAGYYFVYVITPYDLDWHLGTSLRRLWLQLLPSGLFIYFMVVRSPDEVAKQADSVGHT